MLSFSRLLLELKRGAGGFSQGATESEPSGSSVAGPHLDNEVKTDLILTPRHQCGRWHRGLRQFKNDEDDK